MIEPILIWIKYYPRKYISIVLIISIMNTASIALNENESQKSELSAQLLLSISYDALIISYKKPRSFFFIFILIVVRPQSNYFIVAIHFVRHYNKNINWSNWNLAEVFFSNLFREVRIYKVQSTKLCFSLIIQSNDENKYDNKEHSNSIIPH